MIKCERCDKENQAHYKFCLGCGAELPRDAEAKEKPKKFRAPTPPSGMAAVKSDGGMAAAPAGNIVPPKKADAGEKSGKPAESGVKAASKDAEPKKPEAAKSVKPAKKANEAPADAGDDSGDVEKIPCPKCGEGVPKHFKFCGGCGNPMDADGAVAKRMTDAPATAAKSTPSAGALVLIRPDGSEGEPYPLQEQHTIGRSEGSAFEHDAYLSPEHAKFDFSGGKLKINDLKSLNGVYLRIEANREYELRNGAVFRIGQEIIRYEKMGSEIVAEDGADIMGSPNPGYIGRIRLVVGREGNGNSYCIPAQGLLLGRERGDVIFPEDGYVSGLHCRLHAEGETLFLTDVGSSNGTFMRIDDDAEVESGTLVLMGQQLFRVDY